MNDKFFIKEIFVSGILVLLAALLYNPTHMWMPDSVAMMIILIFVIVFAIFANFVWYEHVGDERDNLHRLFAARVAYLVGSGVLVFGIAIQGISHNVDVWLLYVLGAMVCAKAVTLFTSKFDR